MIARILLAAAVAAAALPAAVAAPGPMTAVTLRIVNGAGAPLRCEAVLAHFMSEAVAEIGDGDEQEVALRREPESGLLALSPREGRDVPLENLQCGLVADWGASVQELPLTALRDSPAQAFRATCALEGSRLDCPVEELR